MTDIYKEAAKRKLRFEYKGTIDTEDLYDLSLEALNKIYVALKKSVGDDDISLIKPAMDEETSIKIAIVQDVYNTKVAEAEAKETAAKKKAEKERLIAILKNKQEAKDASLSEEELIAKINAL